MKHAYKIEAIRDDFFTAMRRSSAVIDQAMRLRGRIDLIRDVFTLGETKRLPWIAEIVGIDARYGFSRRFISGQKDYTESNGVGSRGVYIHYILDGGRIYEVAKMASWKKQERYFFRLDDYGNEQQLTAMEVRSCLSENVA